ncbi:hypothetical protein NBG4_500023 [Candidatus Sulfobium mesophilum]|uniref:Ice-binding protein C-terminal domain-containing protein n=1 Tax=Candidatus Sulfobium mesophilum TaxID=2016548 RepID=A0A2U3QJ04_9BACT|nr:hypothetical protein NBG4_500023 [Candidatus Sulfobium mesophilum]
MKIRHSVASLFIVLLPLIIGFLPSSSYALFVTDQLTINFIPPDPIHPGDPTFTSLTGGEAAIFQGVPFGEGGFLITFLDFITVPTLNAGDSFTITTIPTDPWTPPDPCFFSFAGMTTAVNDGAGQIITQAFPVDPNIPPNPILPTPMAIDIGTFGASLTPLHMTGPIYAFDTTVLVGSWEVTVTPVPEPSTLVLLGAGLAGVGVVRRRVKR